MGYGYGYRYGAGFGVRRSSGLQPDAYGDLVQADGTIVTPFNYHADSSRPDDSGDGLTPETAKKTLAAAKALLNGQHNKSIGLACGSVWREEFSVGTDSNGVDGLTLGAYGHPDDGLPLIRGDNDIPNASFVLSSGLTNTYETTVTFEGAAGTTGNQFRPVFEGVKNLIWAASAAAVDATPGTYFLSSLTALTATLYVRPFGDTMVGKTYSYAKRSVCVDIYGIGVTVKNIRTMRQRAHDGSLVVRRVITSIPTTYSARLFKCTAEDGHKHNAYVPAWSLVDGCTFRNAYHKDGSENLLVCFDNGAGLGGLSVRNSSFVQDRTVANRNVTGVYGHTGNGTDLFAFSITEDCYFEGLLACNPMVDTLVKTSKRDVAINCESGIYSADAGQVTTVDDYHAILNADGVAFLSANARPISGPSVATGSQTYRNSKFYSHTWNGGLISAANVTLEFEDCILHAGANSRFPRGLIRWTAAGGTLKVNRCILDVDNAGDYNIRLVAGTTYTGNNNHFTGVQRWSFDEGTTTLTTLAAWQTATGQDAASDTIGDSSPADTIPA